MENVNNSRKCRTAAYVLAILASFLLMAFLVMQMVKLTRPPSVSAARAAERTEENAKVRAAAAEALKTWGYLAEPPTAKAQGIVRMPIDEAMKVTVAGYKENPAAFRSNILTRVEKANAAVSYE